MEILRASWATNVKNRMSFILCFWCTLMIIGADSQRTDPIEVRALQSIRGSLHDPDNNLEGWRGDPCTSNWTEIVCYNTTLDDGFLHVQELFLLNLNLSGTLSPEVGRLSHLKILDIMWNNISGTIPREIGSISTLELLLLNGNQLTGSLPDELGNLSNLERLQIDQNQISGPIPQSFVNLTNGRHFHMNNCSLSGQVPAILAQLPSLYHLLLDNNNLSGPLTPELAASQSLQIIQLDNNNFGGSIIPSSYGNMSSLLKLSMRNCSLQGPIPDWSNSSSIAYIDLSQNQLTGTIPTGPLSENITTIDLSNNSLTGTLPASFSRLPRLQYLSVANNELNGSVPSAIWNSRTLNSTDRLFLNFQNNSFANITGNSSLNPNITIGLLGNPFCSNNNISEFCVSHLEDFVDTFNFTHPNSNICPPQACPEHYEYAPPIPGVRCFCAVPLYIGYRLKSPGFANFLPYLGAFADYMSSGLQMNLSQLAIDSVQWQRGPRLRMYLKVFPTFVNDSTRGLFNRSEVFRVRETFSGWKIQENEVFGPYEFLNFTLPEPYEMDIIRPRSGITTRALVGIILGTIAGSVTVSAIVALLILRCHMRKHHKFSKARISKKIAIRIAGMKSFSYKEMTLATDDFTGSSVVGQGGYGKVYRGILADGRVVAIKRTLEGSLQGEKEFLTEIELLSRVHHRNLVSLIGYCDDEGEQMLIYEFMPNGTLRDHISEKCKTPLSFAIRVRIAMGAARGILYLHTEANPPIFHRDIKTSNILLDAHFTAKVADFGLSRLAPVAGIEGDVPDHISTVVKGTPGYLDPEYFLTHKLTDKSDVYSLGVVLLEMLTGMHPISHGKNIVREVKIAYRSGTVFSVVDGRMGSYPSECIERFITLALNCTQEDTDSRPSMAEVTRELESVWLMLPESDTRTTSSSVTDNSGNLTSPSSSSSLRNPCISQELSGSDLVSGVVHSVAPR